MIISIAGDVNNFFYGVLCGFLVFIVLGNIVVFLNGCKIDIFLFIVFYVSNYANA